MEARRPIYYDPAYFEVSNDAVGGERVVYGGVVSLHLGPFCVVLFLADSRRCACVRLVGGYLLVADCRVDCIVHVDPVLVPCGHSADYRLNCYIELGAPAIDVGQDLFLLQVVATVHMEYFCVWAFRGLCVHPGTKDRIVGFGVSLVRVRVVREALRLLVLFRVLNESVPTVQVPMGGAKTKSIAGGQARMFKARLNV